MDERIENGGREIIDASRVVMPNGGLPARVVLVKLDDEYVTWVQTLRTADPGEGNVKMAHDAFMHGHYFRFDSHGGKDGALARATKDFNERAKRY